MQRMGDALGLRYAGTLSTSASTNGTSTIFEDTLNRWEADDFCNEGYVILNPLSSTAQQERRVSDFANATARGTIYGTWTTTVASGAGYDLYLPPVTPAQYRSAIKSAASKLTASGLGRRAFDTTLVTTYSHRYALPTAIDLHLSQVWIQRAELIGNNDWAEDDTGWTLSNSSLSNDGSGGARTLKLSSLSAGSGYVEVHIGGNEGFQFFAETAVSTGAVAGVWTYTFLDSSGGAILSSQVCSSMVNATSSFVSGSQQFASPINAATLRLNFRPNSGTVEALSQAPNLMRYGDWERLADGNWHVEYESETAYLVLHFLPPRGRRMKLIGKRTLESLSSDSDTLSLDEPEIVAFTELACAEAWRQFGGRLGLNKSEVNDEVGKHESEYRTLISRMSGEWRQDRTVRSPRFY